jgi:ABC-type transport system substrate-binding protein
MKSENEFSIGINAPLFPRDPLQINVFLEHVLIGQILEPLFTLGNDGFVKGAAAEKWEYSSDQTELTINLKKDILFSNGKNLTSEDVKFSLERHVFNSISQSFNFLKIIKSIEVVNTSTLKLNLRHKYIPLLLTLSREHLGILPKGWKFDPESNEPYIGTGPYRILREDMKWFLIENKNYRNPEELKIKKWQVEIINTAKNILPDKPSDIYFLIPPSLKDQIFKKFPYIKDTFIDSNSFNFVQYSFWWLKDHFNSFSIDEKKQIREALDLLSRSVVETTVGKISTGIIPPGITGTLNIRPKIEHNSLQTKINISIKISVPLALLEQLNNLIQTNSELRDSHIKFHFVPYEIGEISKIKESNNHLALIAFAGGFIDPEGFLTVLPSMLGRSTSEIFGKKAETIRLNAENELNNTKRAELYREFSIITQEEVRYIPGWIPIFSDIRNSKLLKKPNTSKFFYKLMDFQK